MRLQQQDQTANPIWKVIGASSVGTLIEWYDFYIFGSLAAVIATKFFPEGNPALALLSTLATFAAGFVVRPFGALFFGRLGDLIGRKYTFMATLLLEREALRIPPGNLDLRSTVGGRSVNWMLGYAVVSAS